jgi:Asx homology domain
MARRSGRKTNVPDHFDLVDSIRDRAARTSKKQKRLTGNLLTPSNAFRTDSPILHTDIQLLFAATIRAWSTVPEDRKRELVDVFPPAYRVYDLDDEGKLKCPISTSFAANDSVVKRGVARFKRDIEDGFYLKRWQEEGRRAMRERVQGQFDEYIKQHAEDSFGIIEDVQAETGLRVVNPCVP